MRGAIVTFIYLVLAPIEMHLRRRRYPPPRPPVTGPKTFVTGPPTDPLTIEDMREANEREGAAIERGRQRSWLDEQLEDDPDFRREFDSLWIEDTPPESPTDPLTIEDMHAPPAPTWGAQRGAC